jgi:hypothetical protein
MRRLAVTLGGLAALAGSAGSAETTTKQAELPALYSAVLDCLAVPDRDARLACFEEAATKLKAATEKQDIVVVDRDQIKKTKRTLFGLPLPRIDILGGGSDQDEVKQVDGIVSSAHRDGDGRWVVSLQDGAVWQQIDDRVVARAPRSGFTVRIERATMGTFMMRVQNQPGIRVKRLS